MQSISPSTGKAQREKIARERFEHQSILRRGSLPKWINPKTDAKDKDTEGVSPYVRSPRYESGSEPGDEAYVPTSSQGASDRPVLRARDKFKRVRSLNDLERSPSPSQDQSELRWVINPAMDDFLERPVLQQLCETCQGITFETMAGDGGYDHLFLYELDKSKLTCRMCDQIYFEIGNDMKDHTRDRYRIRLSLHLEVGKTDQWCDDHYVASRGEEREFTNALIEAMDLRPWEPPEHYKTRYFYDNSDNPEEFLKPRGSSPEGIRSRSIHCFTEEHDPSRQIGIRWVRNIGANTASKTSLEIASGWLNKCLSSADPESSVERTMPHNSNSIRMTRRETHLISESQRQEYPKQYPARLVQICETSSGDVTVHLVDTQDRHYRYAALSYCWGKQSPEEGLKWQLTEENDHPHHENIKMDKLAQTVRDGIMIAWKLGITYIWIDALCIVQDNASDWAQEAAKMAGIYRGSVVTIAVSASASAEHGCFNSSSQRTTEVEGFEDLIIIKGKLRDSRKSSLYFLQRAASIPNMYEDEIMNGPLSKRAWTYQEFSLPRRTLYFTSKQLLWECMHCRLSEDNFPQIQTIRPYPILDFQYALGREDIASFWYTGAVEQYSGRQMTFEKDKLVAISALARATYSNRQADYIAGLWRDSLILGLMWCRSSDGQKSKTFPCPSWSWASQNSEVSYHFAAWTIKALEELRWKYSSGDQEDEHSESCDVDQDDAGPVGPTSRVISIDWKPDLANPFGNLSGAHIDLHTILGIGTVIRDHFNNHHWDSDECSQGIMIPYTSQLGTAEWWQAKATMDDSGVAGAHVAVALLRESTIQRPGPVFLLLDPPDLDVGIFRRVGLAKWDEDDRYKWSDYTKNWVEKTIRLV